MNVASTRRTDEIKVVYRTRGRQQGPITRLMSPSDLGEELKPFVFLDLFEFDAESAAGMPLHPHSGIATVTVLAEGELDFDDPTNGTGTIGRGGVEWMRAGRGVWHGKEMTPGSAPRIRGFQLWLALPADLEHGAVESQYIESAAMPTVGPATVILGRFGGVQSPVRAPEGTNYLLVTLEAHERWEYAVPDGHSQIWLASSNGSLAVNGDAVVTGEMALLAGGSGTVELIAGREGCVFVLGSAIPHPHELVLGNYSVHTTTEALAQGENHIRALAEQMRQAGRASARGPVPVFAGRGDRY